MLFAVPDMPSGDRIVGQAVKEHPCLWEVFYEKKEGTAWFLDPGGLQEGKTWPGP